MTTFTVEIQASNADGSIWQALYPAKTINTVSWGDAWTAEDVAKWTADNQTVAEKPYRIPVWEGGAADTGTEPAYILYRDEDED